MGLAWAISEHLCREVGCATLFATHFHDLAALESSLPGAGVANLHVKAAESESGLTMLYQVCVHPFTSPFFGAERPQRVKRCFYHRTASFQPRFSSSACPGGSRVYGGV